MMAITERKAGDVTIIDVEGRVTLEEGADEFRELTRTVIREGQIKLVINLEKVPYIDSTALGPSPAICVVDSVATCGPLRLPRAVAVSARTCVAVTPCSWVRLSAPI